MVSPNLQEDTTFSRHGPFKGPISSVNALGTRVIIINDLQTAIDLLETRSSIYSNRPVFPFAGEL
jgi:hypothetical protein